MCRNEMPVVAVAHEDDFRSSAGRTIDRYDFWELAVESGALKIGHHLSANGRNHHLAPIDTKPHWLSVQQTLS